MTKDAIKPIEKGAFARLKEDVPSTSDWATHFNSGFTFEVEDFMPALKRGDDGYKDPSVIQEAFYTGNANGGFYNVQVPASCVEEVMSAEEARARQVPSRRAIANALYQVALDMDPDDGAFTVFESDRGSKETASFTVYGKTAQGLGFGTMVTVRTVWETDN